ncbi:MAG: PIN domain nuclease [Thiothrix sp.]|nr:MAG: PIN domain nuclease [Thiothrix sp.]
MILVDTSVWIDFFAGRNLPQVQVLEYLIQTDADLALCGIILTEILQGISNDKQHQQVRDYLEPLLRLEITEAIWLEAAELYRNLRKQGITIRKTNDCIIAATALHYKARLLHNDRDFEAIQQHYPLQTNCLVAN